MYCKICNNSGLKLQKIFKKGLSGENLFGLSKKKYSRKLYKCTCGHFYNIHNHASFLKKVYQNNYASISHKNLNIKFNLINSLKNKSSNFQRVKFLKKKIDINSHVLDIGSGIGVFPYEMKKNGFKIDGSETNQEMIKFMKKKRINTFFLDILNSKLNINKYDVVTLNKVLEHFELKKIVIVLKKIKSFLNDNGIIYIEVPSANASKKSLDRQEFYFEHFNIFSKKSFKLLMKNCGFKTVYFNDIYEVNKKYTIRAIVKPV